MNLLKREGNKFRYKDKIIKYFPEHKTYVEPFLGTGAIFFNKPLAKYNILNDHSSFIYNFFITLEDKGKRKKFYYDFKKTLIYDKLLKENKGNLVHDTLFLIYSLFNTSDTLRLSPANYKQNFLKSLKEFESLFLEKLENALLVQRDYKHFFNSLIWKDLINPFIYVDPPYSISKGSLKDNRGWGGIPELEYIIKFLLDKKVKFAISEFNDKEILDLAFSYNLEVIEIDQSKGISATKGKIRKEILLINYPSPLIKEKGILGFNI